MTSQQHTGEAAAPAAVSPVLMRDDSLAHQIRLSFTGKHLIAVSCTCQATGASGTAGPAYKPIAARVRWDNPAEVLGAWRDHILAPGERNGRA